MSNIVSNLSNAQTGGNGGIVNRPHTSISQKIPKNNKIRYGGPNNGQNDDQQQANNTNNQQSLQQQSTHQQQSNPMGTYNKANTIQQQPKMNSPVLQGSLIKNGQQIPGKAQASPSKILPEINRKQNDKQPFQNFLKSKGDMISANYFQEILLNEQDERFRYLLKHGTLRRIEANGNIIFSELAQIPGIWVCYRRPAERDTNLEKLNLDYMELNHIPLLEGEEKLKILTYQHNKVFKIENLVSLPTLLYIDLYDNMIQEIENLNSLPQLRVLLLPKNSITKIKNLDLLSKLEVLDLHSNKIQKIEGIQNLPNLRILNLANNLIQKIENLEHQSNLVELNLKINLIENIENIGHLSKLEKLFISNNRIQDFQSFSALKSLTHLQELNLEGNPVSKLNLEYQKQLLVHVPSLQLLDHKQVDKIRESIKSEDSKQTQKGSQNTTGGIAASSTNSSTLNPGVPASGATGSASGTGANQNAMNEEDENINPDEVIKIIGEQWQQELARVKKLEMQNVNKKEIMKGCLVQGGHAEIEDESILFIFGNAYEIVLENKTFQETIEKIQFQNILFDFLIESKILMMLKDFKKLKEIVFKDNYISSLLQLAKLEVLPKLQYITIENSPLAKCSFLKEFIVYRFPLITKINGKDVKEQDKQKAKLLFHHFDRILQLPEKFYNVENVREYPFEKSYDFEIKKDKVYMKHFTRYVNENSENFTQNVIPKISQINEADYYLELQFNDYLQKLIHKTVVLLK